MAVIQERKTQDGKTKYRAMIRMKGYPPQYATFDRKTDAKNWASQTENAIKHGRYFTEIEGKKHTFGDMIDRYILDVIPNRNDQQKQTALANWWKDKFGAYWLADITPAKIAEARDELLRGVTYRGTKRTPATVVRYMACLSHVYTIVVNEWGWLENNPVKKVKKPTESRGRVRFLDEGERERLLKACREGENPFLYPVVILAISTGMRHGEIMGITWKDVDLERGVIVLHETKNGERRAVALVGHALELVKGLSKVRRIDNPYLFPAHNSPNHADLRKPWEAALLKAEIVDFRFHDLRHTAASYLAMNGATLAEIAEVLGHKTLAMVKRYAHLSEAHTASVVERMNAKIFG